MLNLIFDKQKYEKLEKKFYDNLLRIASFNREITLILDEETDSTITTKANYRSHHDYKSWPPDYNSFWIVKDYLRNDTFSYHFGSCYNDAFRFALPYEIPELKSDVHLILDPNNKEMSTIFFAENDEENTIDALIKIDVSNLNEEELFTINDKNRILEISKDETEKEHYYIHLGNIESNSPSYNLRNVFSNSSLSLDDENYLQFNHIHVNDETKAKFDRKKAKESVISSQLGDFIKDYREKLIPEESVFDSDLVEEAIQEESFTEIGSIEEEIEEFAKDEAVIDDANDENASKETDGNITAEEIVESPGDALEVANQIPEITEIDTFNDKKSEKIEYIDVSEDEFVKNIDDESSILKTEVKMQSIDIGKSTEYLLHHVMQLMKKGRPLKSIRKNLSIPEDVLRLWYDEGKNGNPDFSAFFKQCEINRNKTPHEIKQEKKLMSKLNMCVRSELEFILFDNNQEFSDRDENALINKIIESIPFEDINSSLENLDVLNNEKRDIRKILKDLTNDDIFSFLNEADKAEYQNRTKNERIEKIMSDLKFQDVHAFLEELKNIDTTKLAQVSSQKKFEKLDNLDIGKLKEVQSILSDILDYYSPEEEFTKEDLEKVGFSRMQINHYVWILKDYGLINVSNDKISLKDEEAVNEFVNNDFESNKAVDFSNLEVLSSSNSIFVKGIIDKEDLFIILDKFKDYKNDIIKIVTNPNGEKTDLFIEFNLKKEKISEIKELFAL